MGFMFVYNDWIRPAIERFKIVVADLWESIAPAFLAIQSLFGSTGGSAVGLGAIVGGAFGFIIDATSMLIRGLTLVIGWIVNNFIAPFIAGIADIVQGFSDLITGAESLPNALVRILGGVWQILSNTVLRPFKAMVMGVLEAMNFVGVLSDARFESIRTAINHPVSMPSAEAGEERREARDANRESARAVAAQRGAVAEGNRSPNVTVEQPEMRVEGCIDNRVNLDSREVAAATSHRRFELAQRGGASLNPWQQGAIGGGAAVAMP